MYMYVYIYMGRKGCYIGAWRSREPAELLAEANKVCDARKHEHRAFLARAVRALRGSPTNTVAHKHFEHAVRFILGFRFGRSLG